MTIAKKERASPHAYTCFVAQRGAALNAPELLSQFMEKASPETSHFNLEMTVAGSDSGPRHIVVVDDEPHVCDMVAEALNDISHVRIHSFYDSALAVTFMRENNFDVLICDLAMKPINGIEMLECAREIRPDAIVVVMTAFPTAKTAITALQKGGYDYLVKPFKIEDMKAVVLRGISTQATTRENVLLKREIGLLKVSTAVLSDHKLEDILTHSLESAIYDLGATAVAVRLTTGNSEIDNIQRLRCDTTDIEAMQFLYSSPVLSEAGVDQSCSIVETRLGQGGVERTFIRIPLRWGDKSLGWLLAVINRGRRDVNTRVCDMLAANVSAAISRRLLTNRLSDSYLQAIRALAGAIEARDRYTAGHTERVSQMAETVAIAMGWSEQKIQELRQGCTLHDVGKIGVPDAVLNKTGPLNEYERNIMRKHPELGVRIIENVDFLRSAVPYVLFHHERYDGKGYPMGLEGLDIPPEGRLLAVVDTFDAIVSDRPYRRGASAERAIQELVDFRGTQFDPEVVDVFVSEYNAGRIDFAKLYLKLRTGKGLRASLFADA